MRGASFRTALILAGVLMALGTAAATAEESLLADIRVTGEGEVALRPDVAYVTMAVETHAGTALEAQRENARRITAVVTRLLACGVPQEGIESSGFSLYPERVYDKEAGGDRVSGYRVTNQVTVTWTDLDKVGNIIDAAVGAGANQVARVTFSVADPGRAKQEALRKAAAEARTKAETLAQALGVRLGRVLSAAEETAGFDPPVFAVRERTFGAGDASTPLFPGELTLRARVAVRFAIE